MRPGRLRLRWAALYFAAPIVYVAVGAAGTGSAAALAYFYVALASSAFLILLVKGQQIPLGRLGLVSAIKGRDVLLGVAGFLVTGMFWQVFDATFMALGSSMFWNDEAPTMGDQPGWLLAIYFVGVLAFVPFAEEVWFRGYGVRLLMERNVAGWLSILFTSILFAALHLYGGPGFAAFILLWSIAAGILFQWTGRLWAPLIMHVLNNTFAHVIVPLVFSN